MGDWSVVPGAAPAGGEWSVVPEAMPAAPAGPQVSSLESLARGAFQGVTLGFGDELSGAVRSLIDGGSYGQERDAARVANKEAQEANPLTYGAAELGAGILTPIPGLGAAKAGAGLLAHAGRAAVAGGAAGLGASEADLTKGDFQGALADTVQSALIGGAIGGVAGKIGQKLGRAGEQADDLAIKALAGGESKNSGAAWQKTRRMVNNPGTKAILRESVELADDAGRPITTTLEKVAGKEPDAIKELVEAQTSKINSEIRPIYAQSDAKNGGVELSKYIQHLDDQIKTTAKMPPSEANVYRRAFEEMKDNATQQWGQMARVPSEAVRAEATALQNIGFRTIDPLNPGLQTQVKRDIGNVVRDFVNEHVMQTLGPESHGTLTSLNKRMNAWLGVGTVAAARAEKEAAGRISGRGLIGELAGRGSVVASTIGALASGNPALLLAPLGAKALEHAPAATRVVARQAAKIDQHVKAIAEAAAAGNPWAQRMIQTISQTPGGAARLAALQKQGGSPPGIAPTEGVPDAASEPVAQQ